MMKDNLASHRHEKLSIQCEICSKTFTRKVNLRKHVHEDHSE